MPSIKLRIGIAVTIRANHMEGMQGVRFWRRDAGREVGYCAREILDRWAHDPPEARKVRRAANKAYQLPRRRGLLNGEEEWRTRVRRRGGREGWETHKFQFSRGISVLRTGFTAREDCTPHIDFRAFQHPAWRVSGETEKQTPRILSLVQVFSTFSPDGSTTLRCNSIRLMICCVKYTRDIQISMSMLIFTVISVSRLLVTRIRKNIVDADAQRFCLRCEYFRCGYRFKFRNRRENDVCCITAGTILRFNGVVIRHSYNFNYASHSLTIARRFQKPITIFYNFYNFNSDVVNKIYVYIPFSNTYVHI